MNRLTTEPPLDPPEEIPYTIKQRIERQKERQRCENAQDEEAQFQQRMQDDEEREWAIAQEMDEHSGNS